jgi:hypothetical protein
VLERLVGSYFAIIERIERIGEIQNIQGKVVETLCNILEVPTYCNYFFRNEKNIKWFILLKEKGVFLPDKIKFDEQNNVIFWNILDYLERVSEQLDKKPEYGEELISIINDIVNYSENVRKITNNSIWWSCVKIINNIPNKIFIETLTVEQFYIWLRVWRETASTDDIIISEIGTKLLPKFLNDDAGISYAEAIIDEITKIRLSKNGKHEDITLFINAYWIKETFKQNYEAIGKKCSVDVIYKIADQLKSTLEYEKKSRYANFQTDNSVYQINASRIPIDELKEGEIGFKKDNYVCEIAQYEPDQIKEFDLENKFWELHSINPRIHIKRFFLDVDEKDSFISTIKENLPAEINWTEDDQLVYRVINSAP